MGLLQDISHYWTEQLDPRVADLLFVASSYQVPLIIFAYLYFVLVCGPRFMKNKSPYSLETFMKLYNIVQIVGNGWLLYDCINVGLFSCKLICPVFDYSSMRFVKNAYYYFLLKILDCVETGIFILRKKDNQVSVLHLYHHVSTLFLTWAGVRYYIVVPMIFISMLNIFIHTIMYTYYFLAAYGPNVQKAIAPMKRWITIAQMVQFVVIILYTSHPLILGCKVVNNWVIIIFIIDVLINFYLFYNFYQKTYKKSRKAKSKL